ncbi:hypothetical protein FDW83_11245 [Pseudarthrobacter sp. NamE2]|uniref:hypothetical protein n=1 Tax=Pseudarthrobacter sp. NamE2 TaxID=2576838 RepID=UPI0010FD6278|nr:hypothetical protein [Pseudarthrobacter sp. NamE2]TLM82966.1 hypothetical protein FDW83_11245 [Pseudarthrobacter sp. NamE2]
MAYDVHRQATINAAMAVLSTSTRSLRTAGYAAVADHVIRQATSGEGTPVIVFVGESGRGKSTLVELLAPPIDHRESELADQGLYRLAAPPREGEPSRIWIYPDGTRSEARLDDRDPIGIQFHASSRLGEAVLVDAPSAGGLAGAQSQLNIKLVEGATVAVFVADAGAALSSAELTYLQQCAAGIEVVEMVVTKTDLYPRSWKNVVDENAALLQARLPRLARSHVIGISSVTARAATVAGDPSISKALLEASGVPRLVEVLRTDLAAARTPGLANALRLARTGLEAHRTTLLARLRSIEEPPSSQRSIMDEQERLAELKEQQHRWSLDLDRDLSGLRASLLAETRRNLESWEIQWREKIRETKTLRDAKVSQRLTSDIFAELQTLRAELVAKTEKELQSLIERLFRGVSVPAALQDVLQASTSPEHGHNVGSEPKAPLFDPTLVMTAVMGSTLGTSLAGLLGIGVIAAPLAILGAGGWFVTNRLYRQNLQEKSRLLGEIPRLAQTERAVIAEYLDDRLRAVKPEIVVAYRAELQASLSRVQQLLHESQEHQQLSTQAAQQRIEGLGHEVAVVEKQIAAVDDMLAKLRKLDSGQGTALNERPAAPQGES